MEELTDIIQDEIPRCMLFADDVLLIDETTEGVNQKLNGLTVLDILKLKNLFNKNNNKIFKSYLKLMNSVASNLVEKNWLECLLQIWHVKQNLKQGWRWFSTWYHIGVLDIIMVE